jgi:histone H3/H4
MSADDVQILISYESKNNMSVASWQVHALWDKWKHEVKTDLQARQLSTAMRALEDFYLRTLYELYKINRVCFLASLLSPQYAFYDVEFDNLDPSKLTFDKIMKTKKISVNKQSMAARIIRIAVEELLEYVAKPIESRKVKKYFWEPYKVYIQKIIKKAMEYELSHYDEKWNNVIIMDVANELKEKHILHLLKKDYTRKPKGRDELKRYMVAIFNDIGESAPIF